MRRVPAGTAEALASAAAVAAVAIIGGSMGPQQPAAAAWYLSLRKPKGTPPGPVIGAIWFVLYGLLGVTGYRLLRARPGAARSAGLAGWAATLLGIAVFPWSFFGRKRLGESTVVSAAMLSSAVVTTASAARVDKVAAACSAPVIAWVAAATLLSEELWRRNEH